MKKSILSIFSLSKNLARLVAVCSFVFTERYYVGQWAGAKTARYKKELSHGSLWWGYNRSIGSVFMIFNGTKESKFSIIQIQTWTTPKFSIHKNESVNMSLTSIKNN